MFLVTSNEMRNMDKFAISSFGIPERVLMENAGREAARYFLKLFQGQIHGRVGILAGRGNNGGDAFVIARYLNQKNIPVVVFLLSEKEKVKSLTAAANLNLLTSLNIPLIEIPDLNVFNNLKSDFKNYAVWIDGIVGTGLKADLKKFFSQVITFVNRLNCPIFAIDIPSGLNSDTGQTCGVCIHAFATITFAFPKMGHFLYPGPTYVGQLKIVDIGIPFVSATYVGCAQHLLDFDYVRDHLLVRSDTVHKGITGHLAVIAGSPGKTGAAVLASLAAMRSGAGLVTLCLPERLSKIVEAMLIEVMTVGLPETCLGCLDILAYDTIMDLLNGKKCLLFGPGIGTGSEIFSLLEKLLKSCRLPIVVDADGLNVIAKSTSILKNTRAPVVITPHPGEMARLIGEPVIKVQENRIDIARMFAQRFNVHVILKGASTVIAHPNGEIFINPTGNSGMASGGMGDVLAGMIAAFITQGYNVDIAIRIAVYIHGLSGDATACLKGPYGYLATDLIEQIPEQIGLLYSNKELCLFADSDLLMYRTN